MSRYKLTMKSELSPGTEFLLRTLAGIRVYTVLLNFLKSRNACLPAGRVAKTVTNQMPFIDRVIRRNYFNPI